MGASLIFEDRDGRIWVGTNNGGLFMYLPQSDQFAHFVINEGPMFHAFPVTGMVQDQEGLLWVASFGQGLLRIDIDQGRAVHFHEANSGLRSNYIPYGNQLASLVIDSQNQLWVGTLRGLHQYDAEEQDFVRFTRAPGLPEEILEERVDWIAPDSKGNLWISYQDLGLTLYEPDLGFTHYQANPDSPLSLPSNRVTAWTEDAQGLIWVGTNGSGLAHFDQHSRRFIQHRGEAINYNSLSNDHITTMYVDRTETLWIGTNGAGLNTFHRGRQKFRHYKLRDLDVSMTDQLVWSIHEDDYGQLWVGTRADGIFVLDLQTETLVNRFGIHSKPFKLGSNDIRVLELDRKGTMWIGTAGDSLYGYEGHTNTFRHIKSDPEDPDTLSSKFITCVLEDRQQRFWVGTRNGLNLLDREAGTTRRIRVDPKDPSSLASGAINSLAEDSEGVIWIGTVAGLHALDQQGTVQRFQHDIEDANTLSHNNVMCVHPSRDGLIWIATFGGGLNRLELSTRQFRRFTVDQGLPNDAVYGIMEDADGNLWLSTNYGLAKFDPLREAFRNYDVSDGLQSNEFNLGAQFRSRTGELYFGGINGFNAFFPSAVRDTQRLPPVAITGFTPQGKDTRTEFNPNKPIVLSYRENAFVLEYAALDYTSPHKNQYAYQLEGFDPDWIYVGTKKSVSYTNLDGGAYRFRVKATNSDGIWNETGTAIRIDIKPPFWKTPIFYVLCSLLGLGLLSLAFVIQRRRLQSQQVAALSALELKRKTEELDYARRVQLSMLPDKHYQSPTLEVWGTMKTATEVGGDYYDFFQLDDHRVAVAVGDATGHGMAAGVVVGMLKMATTMWSLNPHASLSETMQRLNLALKRSIAERGMGMGLCLAVVDTRDGRIELVSSGMPYPYHYKRATKSLDTLIQKGPPLGFFESMDLRPRLFHLAPDDLLIFVSDGLIERFNEHNEIWGCSRLELELKRLCERNTKPTAICSKLLMRCDRHAEGRRNDDDMTVLVIHFRKALDRSRNSSSH